MQTRFLQQFFATSPAVRLIRSPHAYWIVDFLRIQFKEAGQITRRHSELTGELDNYLDRISRDKILQDWKADSREKADTYLTAWCSSNIGWLKRYFDDQHDEPLYQLTAEFEKALAFVERASNDEAFVGTESRLRQILDVLGSVATGVADDPERRLTELRRQRDALDAKIRILESSPDANQLTDTQVRERFQLAYQQLQQLKSEFRAVEDRFKSITRSVQQRILASADSRGDILQYALDSEDTLKHGDQGKSFFEFLKLIHSPDAQEQIASLVSQLSQLEALAEHREGLGAIRNMVPTLIAEAEKILRTTQHLSLTLKRLLDARATQHHQQLASVLRDILGLAAEQSEHNNDSVGLEVEVDLDIHCPFDRPFWIATEPFEEVELSDANHDAADQRAALDQLAALERMDWQSMRGNIRAATQSANAPGGVSLEDLLERFPPSLGAIEVLGYIQIAHDDGHEIDATQATVLPGRIAGRTMQLPRVMFLPKRRREQKRNRPLQETAPAKATHVDARSQ